MSSPDFSLSLHPHPRTPAPMVRSLDAMIIPADHGLTIAYRLYGDMARLLIPDGNFADRRDNLWEHTCFEMFIARAGSAAYREFNFSPSGQWAAYDFSAYRTPSTPPARMQVPRIAARRSDGRLELDVQLPADALPLSLTNGALDIGLSAVIESADIPDGPRSYWALRHPVDHPDFHHRDSLAVTFPAPY